MVPHPTGRDQSPLQIVHQKYGSYQAFGVMTGQPVVFQVEMLDCDVRHEPCQAPAVGYNGFASLLCVRSHEVWWEGAIIDNDSINSPAQIVMYLVDKI